MDSTTIKNAALKDYLTITQKMESLTSEIHKYERANFDGKSYTVAEIDASMKDMFTERRKIAGNDKQLQELVEYEILLFEAEDMLNFMETNLSVWQSLADKYNPLYEAVTNRDDVPVNFIMQLRTQEQFTVYKRHLTHQRLLIEEQASVFQHYKAVLKDFNYDMEKKRSDGGVSPDTHWGNIDCMIVEDIKLDWSGIDITEDEDSMLRAGTDIMEELGEE
jgi:hypothetical protein